MLLDAPIAALLAEGIPGAAGTILLLQKWKHKTSEWEAQPINQQERVMGRTKLDSIELENKPSDSHVARTDQDDFGNIFRRNMPYGNVEDHGTVFVGFKRSVSRVPGADPRTSTPAVAPVPNNNTVQPVGRRESVKCPTFTPCTSVMLPAAKVGLVPLVKLVR